MDPTADGSWLQGSLIRDADPDPKNCYQRWIRISANQDPDHIKYGLWLPSNLISVVDPDTKSFLKPDLDQVGGSESRERR